MGSYSETVVGGRLLRDFWEEGDKQELNRPEEIVGDTCGKKGKDCIRLMTQNINGIGQHCNNIKEKSLKDFCSSYNVDIFAFKRF